MFILGTGEFVPDQVVDNEHFARLTGRDAHWFEQRTGILRRHRAGDETVNTMAVKSVESLLASGLSLAGVDLVLAASYTPLDTIATIAHVLQRHFALNGARAIYVSTACSSFLDALDIAQAYLAADRARKILIVAAEKNSAYSRDEDAMSGHLWGDGAAAVLVGDDANGAQYRVVDVQTRGLADKGAGPEAIFCNPSGAGLVMTKGKEVFMHACHEMASITREILGRNGLGIEDLRLLVPHQANKRIIDHVAHDLKLAPEQVAITITELGNTGCASVAITFHRFSPQVKVGEYVLLVTFGGGYSSGAALLKRIG